MSEPLAASYPVLPLRDIVVFPHMIVPLFVGREKSVRALEEVMQDDKQILLSSQIDPTADDPTSDGIYKSGVLANVLQLLKLPDGTVKVLVEGKARVRITEFLKNDRFFEARAEFLSEEPGDKTSVEALLRSVAEEFEKYAKIKKNIPEETLSSVAETREPARMADLVSGHLGIEVAQKQDLLETLNVATRLEKVYRPDAGRDVGAAGREEDQDPRQDADGEDPARILSERADEGDPEGTGRRRGRGQTRSTNWSRRSPRPSCRKRRGRRPRAS